MSRGNCRGRGERCRQLKVERGEKITLRRRGRGDSRRKREQRHGERTGRREIHRAKTRDGAEYLRCASRHVRPSKLRASWGAAVLRPYMIVLGASAVRERSTAIV